MACPSLSPDGPFLSGVLSYVDCQAQAIGQGGYQALAAPGSIVAIAMTGMLTIFIALAILATKRFRTEKMSRA